MTGVQTCEEIIDGIVAYQVEGTTVYVPSFNEISPELPVDTANRWVINWEINHLPPEGAKYWRWGYAGNSLCSWFVQYIISDIDDEIADPPDSVRITITPFQQLKVDTTDSGLDNQFPQSIIDPYDWVKGDRIRFITQTSVGADMGALVDGMYDFEIIKFDVDNDYIYIQDFEWAAAGIGADSLAEIYRPLRVNTETKYYEFGELYPITEDSIGNAVHGSDIQDQDTNLNLPAVGVFDNGDVFHILRTPSKAIDGEEGYFHESQWWSDFYESDEWDIGKIGVETTFNERYLNIIRYSFPYFQNTEINGLPVFRSNQYKELNDIFGNIVAIYEVGDTLKVYQERKASSIQMGRIERIDETGQISVSSSSVVLGSIRYSPSNYSTVFPESISRNNKYIYGFDIYNGVMWRDSVNGIFPISGRYADPGGDSDYKMATWFKDKSKDLLVSGIGHCDVMSVWDEEFKNLHVVFKDYNEELNDATIVFHEPSNRWICFQDLDQTPLSHNVIVECKEYTIVQGFEGGLGYSFDEDTRFAVFDILTPGNKVLTMPLITMNMTAYEPSVQADGIPEGSLVSVGMTAYTPTVHISYVSVDVNNISWNADAYGVSASSTINVTTTENAAVLTSMPAWMTGKNHLLHTLIVGVSTIPDGENMYLYPATQNTGADRTGSVILTDSYGNTASITVTQWGVPDVPEVILEVKSGETFTITDSTPINTYINNGSNQLHIGFTAHDLTLPGGVLLDVEVIKNSVHYMWTNTYGRNEFYLTDTIVLAHTAVASDVYLVILDEP